MLSSGELRAESQVPLGDVSRPFRPKLRGAVEEAGPEQGADCAISVTGPCSTRKGCSEETSAAKQMRRREAPSGLHLCSGPVSWHSGRHSTLGGVAGVPHHHPGVKGAQWPGQHLAPLGWAGIVQVAVRDRTLRQRRTSAVFAEKGARTQGCSLLVHPSFLPLLLVFLLLLLLTAPFLPFFLGCPDWSWTPASAS